MAIDQVRSLNSFGTRQSLAEGIAPLTADRVLVITPVYEDEASFGILLRHLKENLGAKLFVVAVDDGSVKVPLDQHVLSDAGVEGVILKLFRNVGHQRAIAIGIAYAAQIVGQARSVVLDCDGEDRPDTIKDLLAALENPSVDVAVATRKSRIESLTFKVGYAFYKHVFKLLTGKFIDFGNFAAYNSGALKRMSVMFETSVHVAAALMVSRLRIQRVPLDRGARYAGQSKMNTVGLVLHGFRSVMIFAENVMVRLGIFSGVLIVACATGMGISVLLKVIGLATPGWFSIALALLTLTMLQTAVLALISLLLTGVIKFYPQSIPDNLGLVQDELRNL